MRTEHTYALEETDLYTYNYLPAMQRAGGGVGGGGARKGKKGNWGWRDGSREDEERGRGRTSGGGGGGAEGQKPRVLVFTGTVCQEYWRLTNSNTNNDLINHHVNSKERKKCHCQYIQRVDTQFKPGLTRPCHGTESRHTQSVQTRAD